MRSNQNNMPDDMLAKYMLGEASGAERDRMEEWMKQDEGNRKYYDQLQAIWNASSKLATASNINTEQAWQRFKTRREQSRAPRTKYFVSLKLAAMILLLAGGCCLSYLTILHKDDIISKPDMHTNVLPGTGLNDNVQQDPVLNAREIVEHADEQLEKNIVQKKMPQPKKNTSTERKKLVMNSVSPVKKENNNMNKLATYYKKKEIVCNGTACPIEICIIQSAKCKNREDSKISTCSTLEPDESGQLHYKTYDRTLANCVLSIEEIRITRLSTGETIVLNDSTDVKAQDLFNYITGRKKGNIVAGIFHTDCNNHNHSHDLTFDNKLGDLLLK